MLLNSTLQCNSHHIPGFLDTSSALCKSRNHQFHFLSHHTFNHAANQCPEKVDLIQQSHTEENTNLYHPIHICTVLQRQDNYSHSNSRHVEQTKITLHLQNFREAAQPLTHHPTQDPFLKFSIPPNSNPSIKPHIHYCTHLQQIKD